MVHRRWWLLVGVLFTSMGLTGSPRRSCPLSRPSRRPGRAHGCPRCPVPDARATDAAAGSHASPCPSPRRSPSRCPVPTPAVSAPSVSTPSVSTPAGSVPSVTTPSVSTTSAEPAQAQARSRRAPPGLPRRTSGCRRRVRGRRHHARRVRIARRERERLRHGQRARPVPPTACPTAQPRQGPPSRPCPAACRPALPGLPAARAAIGASRAHAARRRRRRPDPLADRGRPHHPPAPGARDHARAPRAAPAARPRARGRLPGRTADGVRGGAAGRRRRAARGERARHARRRPGRASGQRQQTAAGAQGHHKPTAELSISRPPVVPGTGGFDLTLVFAALGLLAFVFVVTREVKRTD